MMSGLDADSLPDREKTADHLSLSDEPSIACHLGANEKILWSGICQKTNKARKVQDREFAVTSLRLLNVGVRGNFFLRIFSSRIKRAISVKLIEAVTYSSLSDHFVIHVPSEYDYYLSSPLRDEMIACILRVQKGLGCDPMKVFFVAEKILFDYSKTDAEIVDKRPNEKPILLDVEGFLLTIAERNRREALGASRKSPEIEAALDPVTEDSFELIKVLGKEGIGKVYLAEKKDTKTRYALKVISKFDIVTQNFFEKVKSEREILTESFSPFIVRLEAFFSTKSHVFFALEFKQGGELYEQLRSRGRFDEDVARFYACQVLLGLEHLHKSNTAYRDLKPENILLDERGNACLANFGVSKKLEGDSSTKSFVGTPEYVSPEVVSHKGHDKKTDFWSFGVLVFEMVFGFPPFFSRNSSILLSMISKNEPDFPKDIAISAELRNLIGRVD